MTTDAVKRSRGGRPKGAATRSIAERNTELFDKVLLDVLKNGVRALDKKGQVVTLSPSAAMLNVIRARVRDLSLNTPVRAGSSAGDLIQDAIRQRLRFNGESVRATLAAEDHDLADGLERARDALDLNRAVNDDELTRQLRSSRGA